MRENLTKIVKALYEKKIDSKLKYNSSKETFLLELETGDCRPLTIAPNGDLDKIITIKGERLFSERISIKKLEFKVFLKAVANSTEGRNLGEKWDALFKKYNVKTT